LERENATEQKVTSAPNLIRFSLQIFYFIKYNLIFDNKSYSFGFIPMDPKLSPC